ncbi:hypothetical protein GQ457_07G033940 [Hibiscus cannabinus]
MEKKVGNAGSSLAYNLLFSCPFGLSQPQLSVVFDESYDRIPHSDMNLENSISEIWDQRVQKNGSLFNGKKFRSEEWRWIKTSLHLGLTDYRTFVGTNLNPSWEKFLVASEDDPTQCQHTSSPLGNGAIVETSDKKIVVLERSNNVGEFPGHFVFPGGHPEHQDVGIETHKYNKDSKDSELVNKKVSQEMFESTIREVVEEIGVPATSLVYQLYFFFIKCSLESKEIHQLYSKAQDGYESTQLYTVSMIEVEQMTSKMPGCHQGGFALYKLMIEASKNTCC